MSYTVFARKYRPTQFEDLIGQEHVSRTLQNAIQQNRVAHAFIFTGARGIGKTTSARILAKALNCEKGPTPTPCNTCNVCKDIMAGMDLDVLEIDGASNNSVDDVRRLQETLPFRPTRDRFRIVIVDEVHMLSTGAFNAFLKTLEEPPAHVKFIFATTEIHKVPITIRSRCQRYDFRLIPDALVTAHLERVLAQESLSAEPEAIQILVRQAAGSLRDALTLLDQVVAYGAETLRAQDVLNVLGIASEAHLIELALAVLEHRANDVIQMLDHMAQEGRDLLQASRRLVELFRDFVVLHIYDGNTSMVSLTKDTVALIHARIRGLELLEIERAFAGASKLADEISRSETSRALLEMGLVRLASRPPLMALTEILERLQNLEKAVGAPPSSGANEPPRKTPTTSTKGTGSNVASTSTAAEARPVTPNPVKLAKQTSVQAKQTPDTMPSEPAEMWRKIVGLLRERKPALAAVMEHGALVEHSSERWVIGFPQGSFFGRQAQAPDALDELKKIAHECWALQPNLQIISLAAEEERPLSVAQTESIEREKMREEKRQKALSHPLVIEAMQVFPEAAAQVEVELDIG